MKPLPVIQEAFKVALAMTIAYGISLQMNWENPKWAGFAVAVISLGTVGQSLNKALLRMGGTLLGAVVALTLIGLFIQDRWLFILSVSLWLGFCAYMNTGPRYQYFWFVAGFVIIIIAGSSTAEPGNAFLTALLRTQQTGLGILVYSLVALLLWPRDSRQQLESAAAELADTQRAMFPATLAVLRKESEASAAKPLYGKQGAQVAQLAVQLEAASADSDQVRASAQHWRRYRVAAQQLAESMRHWYETFDDLGADSVRRIAPLLDALGEEHERRFKAIRQMLDGGQPGTAAAAMDMSPADAELERLAGFHHTAMQCFAGHLRDIDRYSHELYLSLCAIRGHIDESEHGPVPVERPRFGPFVPDPDRVQVAVKVMLAIWLAFLAVIYIPAFPGGFGFISIVGPFALIILCAPQVPIGMLYRPLGQSLLWGALLYMFVMPRLSSFAGLGLMIFLVVFLVCYTYTAPADQLKRAMALPIFAVMIAVSNDNQSFSFLVVANTVLMITFMFVLLNIVAFSFRPPVPQQVFLGMTRRYFRGAETLLRQAQRQQGDAQLTRRQLYHLREVSALPGKMQPWLGKVSEAEMGAETMGQAREILAHVSSMAYRLPELLRSRVHIAVPVLAGPLDDWLAAHARAFGLLAQRPAAIGQEAGAGLAASQRALENCLVAELGRTDGSGMTPGQREQAYRLLCSSRMISRYLTQCLDCCAEVDWQPWYEERFA